MFSTSYLILTSGEFTTDSQQRLKQEEDKDQTKLDDWKVGSIDLAFHNSVFYCGILFP